MAWVLFEGFGCVLRAICRRVAPMVALFPLAACANLPSSGPTADAVSHAAHEPGSAPFAIVDLTPDMITHLASPPPGLVGWSASEAIGTADIIGPGDGLQISVFEVGASLFSSHPSPAGSDAAPSTAAGVAMPAVVVARDGTIKLPYVGQIVAAGSTTSALATKIEAGLARHSQAPQVVVSIHDNIANTIMVMGDVKKPGRIPLTLARERLLDAVAEAGGLVYPAQDSMVRLNRGGRDLIASMTNLHPGFPTDVVLAPQDRLEIVYSPRSFTVFGATGKVQEVPFQTPQVSLAEAIARAGGPSDQQADPSAVFVFRYERSETEGIDQAGSRPVAYRLNLLKAQSYFTAQRFQIQPHDVIYIANAKSDQPTKLIQILNLFFQPVYTGKVLAQ